MYYLSRDIKEYKKSIIQVMNEVESILCMTYYIIVPQTS